MRKRRGQVVDGVVLLDKPLSLSSNHALQRVRRILDAQKGGHTGTLDPFATGLMILCFGQATKFSGQWFASDKTYQAEIQFGQETDSGDLTGVITSSSSSRPTRQSLLDAMQMLTGAIQQIPPMYSALKRDGKPLYEYAREGIELERAPRDVSIYDFRLIEFWESKALVEVHCSKGTYIRTLAQDLGRILGCFAHLTALRRTRTAEFDVSQAYSLDRLESLDDPRSSLLPVDILLNKLSKWELDAEQSECFKHGQPIKIHTSVSGLVCVIDPNRQFLGTAEIRDSVLHPERLISF